MWESQARPEAAGLPSPTAMRPGYWDNNYGILDWRLAVLECLDVGAPVEVEFMRCEDYTGHDLGDALYDAVLKQRVRQVHDEADVEFQGLVAAEGGPLLREHQLLTGIRPRPPPTPAEWSSRLKKGCYANMRDEAVHAWFLVRVVSVERRGAGSEPTAAVVYHESWDSRGLRTLRDSNEQLTHAEVAISQLRPAWDNRVIRSKPWCLQWFADGIPRSPNNLYFYQGMGGRPAHMIGKGGDAEAVNASAVNASAVNKSSVNGSSVNGSSVNGSSDGESGASSDEDDDAASSPSSEEGTPVEVLADGDAGADSDDGDLSSVECTADVLANGDAGADSDDGDLSSVECTADVLANGDAGADSDDGDLSSVECTADVLANGDAGADSDDGDLSSVECTADVESLSGDQEILAAYQASDASASAAAASAITGAAISSPTASAGTAAVIKKLPGSPPVTSSTLDTIDLSISTPSSPRCTSPGDDEAALTEAADAAAAAAAASVPNPGAPVVATSPASVPRPANPHPRAVHLKSEPPQTAPSTPCRDPPPPRVPCPAGPSTLAISPTTCVRASSPTQLVLSPVAALPLARSPHSGISPHAVNDMPAVRSLLVECGLDSYAGTFEAQGYDHLGLILSLQHDPQALAELAQHTSMLPGHVARLKWSLGDRAERAAGHRAAGDDREPHPKRSRH